MRLSGNLKIELTDVESGEVTTVEQDNMITNSVNNILGTNLCGAMYYYRKNNVTKTALQDNLLPICPNMIGGLLLFSNELEEDADNLYPTSDNLPVAYASNDVNSTTDVQRGSLSTTEGGETDDGYKFVWEFTAAQGNGTIAAAALTSALGGAGGYGSIADDASAFLALDVMTMYLDDEYDAYFFCSVEVDFENNTVISIAYESSVVTITKLRIPIVSVGLKEYLDDTSAEVIETVTITCTTFAPSSTYHTFVDGRDGYWYGLGNSANSSGSATLYWIKINKDDYTFEEGCYSLSNVTMTFAGYRSSSTYRNKCAMRDGYVYIPSYDAAGVYKIKIGDETDVTLIELGFTSAAKSLCASTSYGLYLARVQDLIIGYDYQILADDTVVQTVGSQRFEYTTTQLYPYENFLLFWSTGSTVTRRYLALLTPYLATICNLDTAVVKTSDMTMKITYTLTETE